MILYPVKGHNKGRSDREVFAHRTANVEQPVKAHAYKHGITRRHDLSQYICFYRCFQADFTAVTGVFRV